MKTRKHTLRTFNKRNCLIMIDETVLEWQKAKDRYIDANTDLDIRRAETIIFILGQIRNGILNLKERK